MPFRAPKWLDGSTFGLVCYAHVRLELISGSCVEFLQVVEHYTNGRQVGLEGSNTIVGVYIWQLCMLMIQDVTNASNNVTEEDDDDDDE